MLNFNARSGVIYDSDWNVGVEYKKTTIAVKNIRKTKTIQTATIAILRIKIKSYRMKNILMNMN